jgi:hypothetical protein
MLFQIQFTCLAEDAPLRLPPLLSLLFLLDDFLTANWPVDDELLLVEAVAEQRVDFGTIFSPIADEGISTASSIGFSPRAIWPI